MLNTILHLIFHVFQVVYDILVFIRLWHLIIDIFDFNKAVIFSSLYYIVVCFNIPSIMSFYRNAQFGGFCYHIPVCGFTQGIELFVILPSFVISMLIPLFLHDLIVFVKFWYDYFYVMLCSIHRFFHGFVLYFFYFVTFCEFSKLKFLMMLFKFL